MQTALLILAVLIFVAAAALGVAYWRYRRTPARVWKGRVFALVQGLQTRRDRLRTETAVVDAAFGRLATEAFTRHLQTVPITRLAEFSGIGPATIGKLQEVRLRHLADVVNFHFETLPDVGQARATSLRIAVDSLVREAQARFDAGGCPEAQEYRRQVDALRATEEEQHTKRMRELVAVEAALHDVFDLFPFAREVTFLHFVFRIDVATALAGLMARPLPSVPELAAEPSPPPVARPAPMPPAVPPVAAAVAAAPAVRAFPLPPVPPPQKPVTSPPPAPLAPPAPPVDLFRAALEMPSKPTANAPPSSEPAGLPPMRALVAFGFMVAKIDGRVAQAERKAIRAFLEQSFGHDPILRRNIDPLMEQFGKNTPSEADALAMVRGQVPLAERMPVYRWAEQIADAAGERNTKEREALARIESGLELSGRSTAAPPPPKPTPTASPPAIPAPPSQAPQAESDHRATLEIAKETPLDPELIRRRFQSLTEKLDPARAAAFGPEFVHMAEQKRARIRAAAEALIAPFNEPLEKPVPPPPTDLRHNPDLDDVFGA